jgi:hypothetical protein
MKPLVLPFDPDLVIAFEPSLDSMTGEIRSVRIVYRDWTANMLYGTQLTADVKRHVTNSGKVRKHVRDRKA